jgi:hypothetical protein
MLASFLAGQSAEFKPFNLPSVNLFTLLISLKNIPALLPQRGAKVETFTALRPECFD